MMSGAGGRLLGWWDLDPMLVRTARQVAGRWQVPLDRQLVLTIGRTDPTKGIDLLIRAVGPLRDEVHVVIIAVPFGRDDSVDRRSTGTRSAAQ